MIVTSTFLHFNLKFTAQQKINDKLLENLLMCIKLEKLDFEVTAAGSLIFGPLSTVRTPVPQLFQFPVPLIYLNFPN